MGTLFVSWLVGWLAKYSTVSGEGESVSHVVQLYRRLFIFLFFGSTVGHITKGSPLRPDIDLEFLRFPAPFLDYRIVEVSDYYLAMQLLNHNRVFKILS